MTLQLVHSEFPYIWGKFYFMRKYFPIYEEIFFLSVWWASMTTLFVVPAPARLHRLTESISRKGFLGSINVYKYGLWLLSCTEWPSSRKFGRITLKTLKTYGKANNILWPNFAQILRKKAPKSLILGAKLLNTVAEFFTRLAEKFCQELQHWRC